MQEAVRPEWKAQLKGIFFSLFKDLSQKSIILQE